jgi:hypothetical protein
MDENKGWLSVGMLLHFIFKSGHLSVGIPCPFPILRLITDICLLGEYDEVYVIFPKV